MRVDADEAVKHEGTLMARGFCERETGIRIYPDPPATHLQEKLDWLEQRRLNLFKP